MKRLSCNTHPLLRTLLAACILLTCAQQTLADVALPNGNYNDSVEEMRVKVLGGTVRLERQYLDERWQFNPRWNPLKIERDSLDQSIKSIDRNGVVYKQQSDAWVLDNKQSIRRHSVSVLPSVSTASTSLPTLGIPGSGGQPLTTANGLRWQNRSGDWIDYDDQGRILTYGDKNDVKVWFQYDSSAQLRYVLDHLGRVVLIYQWSNGRLTEIRDNPEDPSQTRRVSIGYFPTSSASTPQGYNQAISKITDALGQTTHYSYGEIQGPPSNDYTCTEVYEDGMLVSLVCGSSQSQSRLRITKIIDPLGRQTQIAYGATGRISRLTHADGTSSDYQYQYDSTKRQFYVQQKRSDGQLSETWQNNEGQIIRRDQNSQTQSSLTVDGRKRTEKDPRGLVTTRQLDEWDNPVKITYPDGSSVSMQYDPVYNNLLQQTDENGNITRYDYDPKGNLIRHSEALGSPQQRITEYSHDPYGNRLSATRLADANSAEAQYRYTYDQRGNRITRIDPEGNSISYLLHDNAGNVLTQQDPRGNISTFAYNPKGQTTRQTNPLGDSINSAYDAAGNKIKDTDARGNITTYAYDARNQLQTTTFADTTAIQYTRNPDGQITQQTDPAGKITRYAYDPDGRLTQITDGNGNIIKAQYGSQPGQSGLLDQINYPSFSQILSYDPRGRVTQSTDILGPSTQHHQKTVYDKTGNRTSSTDPEGKLTQYQYDPLGRLSQITDPAGGITRYTYDNRDNLIAIQDANGNSTRYSYDRNNRLSQETQPLGQTTQYQYDPNGNLSQSTDANGQIKRHQYDSANQRSQETHHKSASPADLAAPSKTISYHTDRGLPIGYTDGMTSQSIQFDLLNRKTQETVNYGPFSLAYQYTYTANGKKKSYTGPDGTTHTYTYDPNNQLQNIQLPIGNISVNQSQWNAPALITYPGGHTRRIGYDPLMRITSIGVKSNTQNTQMDYRYRYDKTGNILEKTSEHGTYTYSYDATDRLTAVDNPTLADQTLSYDAVGNRKTDSQTPGVTWSYNANNQLNNDGTSTYSYDANGNQTQKVTGSAITTYRYDSANRLSQINNPDGSVQATYDYDPYGRRLSKTIAGIKTYYFYSDEGLIGEYNATGAAQISYGYAPDSTWGTDPLYQKTASGYAFYLNDHLGTPQKLIGLDGNPLWLAQYSAFGAASVDPSSKIQNNLRFPGQYFDAESGLHQNYYRDYDPRVGRYIQPDPLGWKGGINLYAYAENNPVRFTDPLGLAIWICNRGVKGFPFFGNHAYLWDDRSNITDKNRSCGMQGSFGIGPKGAGEKGPKMDSCMKVSGSDWFEDGIMTCCKNNANNGLWTPGVNDCHNTVNDCIAEAGLASPGAPGGRVGPRRCDPCGRGATRSW